MIGANMASYELKIFTAAAFGGANIPPNWTGSGDNVYGNGTGAHWQWAIGVQFSVNPAVVETVVVNDGDAPPGDVALDDDSWASSSQVVGASSNTSLFPVGARIENEYEVTLTDGNTEYRLVAISDGTTIFGYTFDGAWPPPDAVLTVVPDSWEDNQSMVPCFTAGVSLETGRGPVAIEDLAVGDLILTRDHGLQPVRWIGSRVLSTADLARSPNLRPIRIRAGALGNNVPSSDLVVSPQHRVLVRSKIAQRMFGAIEVLAAAKQLLHLDGIDIADDLSSVEYFHILFDRHEVVISNGAETESLYTGKEALKAVGPAARAEIFALFPELREGGGPLPAARLLSSGKQARKLAMRHARHGRPLVC